MYHRKPNYFFSDERSEIRNEFLLFHNYPNPFNPSTIINYQIAQTRFVSLKVYDLLGREVATLINEEKPAGSYEVEFKSSVGKWVISLYFTRR